MNILSKDSELLHPDGPTKPPGMNDFWLLLAPTDWKIPRRSGDSPLIA